MRYRNILPTLSLALCLPAVAFAQDAAAPPTPDEASAASMPAAAPPAAAETAAPSDAEPAGPTPAQTLSMSEWPAEKRSAYDSWPANVQSYYWTLTDPRQGLFWRLGNEDKVKLAAIPPDSQSAAWEHIEKMAAAPHDASSTHSDDKPKSPGR